MVHLVYCLKTCPLKQSSLPNIKAKYTAFIDLFDILTYVVEVLNLPVESSEDWVVSSQFTTTSCLTLVGRSPRSSWTLIGEEAPLQAAINALQHAHRLAVVDSVGNLVSVLSQSRVVRWLASRSEWVMGEIATMTVDDLGLGYRYELRIGTTYVDLLTIHVVGMLLQ